MQQRRLRLIVRRAQEDEAANTPPLVPVTSGAPVNPSVFQADFPLGVAQRTPVAPAKPNLFQEALDALGRGAEHFAATPQGKVLGTGLRYAGNVVAVPGELAAQVLFGPSPAGAPVQINPATGAPYGTGSSDDPNRLTKAPRLPLRDQLGNLVEQFNARPIAQQFLASGGPLGGFPGVSAAEEAAPFLRVAQGLKTAARGTTKVAGEVVKAPAYALVGTALGEGGKAAIKADTALVKSLGAANAARRISEGTPIDVPLSLKEVARRLKMDWKSQEFRDRIVLAEERGEVWLGTTRVAEDNIDVTRLGDVPRMVAVIAKGRFPVPEKIGGTARATITSSYSGVTWEPPAARAAAAKPPRGVRRAAPKPSVDAALKAFEQSNVAEEAAKAAAETEAQYVARGLGEMRRDFEPLGFRIDVKSATAELRRGYQASRAAAKPAKAPLAAEPAPGAILERGAGGRTAPTSLAAGQDLPPPEPAAPVAAAGAPPPVKPPAATGGVPPGGEVPPTPPSYDAARAKLMSLVKAAKPVRGETEAMRTAARAQQAAVMNKIYASNQGQEAFIKARSSLKGELPKATFTPPEASMTPGEVKTLFNRVQEFPAYQGRPFTVQGVQGALQDLLAGKLPQPKQLIHLEDVFGTDFVKTIVDSRKSMGQKAWETALQGWNLPRTLVSSTIDLSYSLRQGFFLSVGQLNEWRAGMGAQLKALRSEAGYKAVTDAIVSNPQYESALAHGLDLTIHPGARGLLGTEEAYQGANLAEKIPLVGKVVRISERAAVAFANRLRMDTYASEAAKLGPDALSSDLDHLAKAINIASGRGTLGSFEAAGPFLNGLFFAPKNAASRFEMPYLLATKNPTLLKMGARNLVGSIGTATALLALAKLSGVADVNLDPNSSDFGKGRVGNTRFDLFAGELQVVVLISRLISGQITPLSGKGSRPTDPVQTIGYFLEKKLNPPAAAILAWKTGKDVIGQKTTPGEVAFNGLVGLTIQDILDAVHDEQNWGRVALTGAASGVGIGVGTFQAGSKPAHAPSRTTPSRRSRLTIRRAPAGAH